MTKIITTSEAQKNIGKISKEIDQTSFIITNKGKGKMVVLPYFDGCDQNILEFQEDYIMNSNKEALQKKYQDSADSGESDLCI